MKKTRKGFTLVELLVVIAIVAILATVAIIGYTSFVKKAELSNDQAAVTQMNTGLLASAIPNGFENPSDAIEALYNLGWNVGKLETYSSGFHYVYNHSNNKMYLLNEKDEVIYPEENVNKSDLWGFFDSNSSGLLKGITKYIAMSNITSLVVFGTETQYEIDLNRHFVDVDGNYSNITLKNGGIVNGDFPDADGVVKYTKYVPVDQYTVSGTFTNVVFDDYVFTEHIDQRFVDAKFVNCIFYDSTLRTEGNVEFIDCEFIGSPSSAIDIYDGSSSTPSYTVKITGCKFTGGYRAINTSGQTTNTNTNIDLIIDGCEFNAVGAEKGIIQIARIKQTVSIKNTTFNALGQSKGIISLHGTILDFTGASADAIINQFTFENNTINEDIPVDQYVFWRSEPSDAYANVDGAITNLMK